MIPYDPGVYITAGNLVEKAVIAKAQKKATFWDWIKLNIFQIAASGSPSAQTVIAGNAAEILRATKPEIPETAPEALLSASGTVGKAIGNFFSMIWRPLKWILLLILFLFVLWLFIGRKKG